MLKTNLIENWDDGQFPSVFCWPVTYDAILAYMHVEVMLWASSGTVGGSYAGHNYWNVNTSKSVGGYWTWLVRYQLVSDRLTVSIHWYLTIESGRMFYMCIFFSCYEPLMLSFVRCHRSRSSDHGVGTWSTTFIIIKSSPSSTLPLVVPEYIWVIYNSLKIYFIFLEDMRMLCIPIARAKWG